MSSNNIRVLEGLQGFGGIPFRTTMDSIPSYREDDHESKRPQLVYITRCATFDTRNKEQREQLEKTLTLAMNGQVRILEKQTQFVEADKAFLVFLLWADLFLADPNDKGAKAYVSQPS